MSKVPITIMVDRKQLLAVEYEATQKGFEISQKMEEHFEKMHKGVSDKTKAMIDFLDGKGVFDAPSQPEQAAPRRTRGRASASQIVNGEATPATASQIVNGEQTKGQLEFNR